MKGAEFLKKAKRHADRCGLELRFVKAHGKGSHGTLYLGQAKTTLKDRKKEIGPGLLGKMLKDLGIPPDQF